MANAKTRICAVVGIGPGNGEALARRFSADGYAVALMARRTELTSRLAAELPHAKAYVCDVADAASAAAAFEQARAELGDVDVLVYNAGSGVWGSIDDVSAEDFERSWRVNTLGLFLCAKQVIPAMRAKGRGAVVVVGATASRRGGAGAAAFGPAKMAQKGLAEFDGPASGTGRDPRRADRRRRDRAHARDDGAISRPAAGRLDRAGRRRRHRGEPRRPGPLRLEL